MLGPRQTVILKYSDEKAREPLPLIPLLHLEVHTEAPWPAFSGGEQGNRSPSAQTGRTDAPQGRLTFCSP